MITSKIDNYVRTTTKHTSLATNAIVVDTKGVKHLWVAKMALWVLYKLRVFKPYMQEHTIHTFSALEESITELHNIFWELIDQPHLRDEDFTNLVLLVGNVEFNELRSSEPIHSPLNFRMPLRANNQSRGTIMDGLDVYVIPQMSGYLLVNRNDLMEKQQGRGPVYSLQSGYQTNLEINQIYY